LQTKKKKEGVQNQRFSKERETFYFFIVVSMSVLSLHFYYESFISKKKNEDPK
tara:strand:+ start:194 stop:352 length:159 start_codon:yes stop_codon:yes gene_type:complete